MKKVSIIIPVYNSERYIGETITSALSQTWRNKEIIVVNDGSTDNSLREAKKFESEEVIVFDQENSGVCAARNKGFELSTGDFVQYLDADDALAPTKIANQIPLLVDEKSISNCPWVKFTSSLEDQLPVENQAVNQSMETLDWLLTAWKGGGMMQTGCWLTPRKVIEKAGPWNEKILMNNDGEFFCRAVLASKKVVFADDAIAYYRIPGNENVSQQKSKKAYESLLNSYMSYEENALKHRDNREVRSAIANNYFSFIYQVSPSNPDLLHKAYDLVQALGVRKATSVGGSSFKKMSNLLGFKLAIKIRDMMSK